MNNKISEKNQENKDLEKKFQEKEIELARELANLGNIEEQYQALDTRYKEKVSERDSLMKDKDNLNKELIASNTLRDSYFADKKNLEEQNKQLTAHNEAMTEQLRDLSDKFSTKLMNQTEELLKTLKDEMTDAEKCRKSKQEIIIKKLEENMATNETLFCFSETSLQNKTEKIIKTLDDQMTEAENSLASKTETLSTTLSNNKKSADENLSNQTESLTELINKQSENLDNRAQTNFINLRTWNDQFNFISSSFYNCAVVRAKQEQQGVILMFKDKAAFICNTYKNITKLTVTILENPLIVEKREENKPLTRSNSVNSLINFSRDAINSAHTFISKRNTCKKLEPDTPTVEKNQVELPVENASTPIDDDENSYSVENTCSDNEDHLFTEPSSSNQEDIVYTYHVHQIGFTNDLNVSKFNNTMDKNKADIYALRSNGYYIIKTQKKRNPYEAKRQEHENLTITNDFPVWSDHKTVTLELHKDKYAFTINGQRLEMTKGNFDSRCCHIGLSGHEGLKLLITGIEYDENCML